MSHLRNTSSGAFTERLDPDTGLYQKLVAQRTAADSFGRVYPLWEEVPEEDLAGSTARVAVAAVKPLALTADDTFAMDIGPLGAGASITSAEYTPDAAIVGADTNTRTLLVKGSAGGTTHCTLALAAAAGTLAAGVGKAFVVNSAAVTGGEELLVSSAHAGTGIADPGGIVTVEYTLSATA